MEVITVNELRRELEEIRGGAYPEQRWLERPDHKIIGLFEEDDDFSYCVLRGCDFTEVTFHRGASLRGADLRGTDFTGNVLVGVNLQAARLEKHPERGMATRLVGTLLAYADLRAANLKDADLTGADLQGSDLRDANLQGANLRRVNFASTKLERTIFGRESLGKRILQEESGEYEDARFIYLNLKENFLSIGAYDDASWAYVRERTMERRTFGPRACWKFHADDRKALYSGISNALQRILPRRLRRLGSDTCLAVKLVGNIAFQLKYLWKLFTAYFLGAVWGYGQKPQHALAVAMVIIAAFTLTYWWLGGIECIPQRSLTALDYVLYSIGAFTATSFSDLTPVTNVAKLLTSLESATGIITFAIFVAALGWRIGGK